MLNKVNNFKIRIFSRHLADMTNIALWKYVKTSLLQGINFEFKNLHQATKKWLPKTVTTFLVFFSNGHHKLTS